MINEKDLCLTITHIHSHLADHALRPGQILLLKKDHDNPFDDEAIKAFRSKDIPCGYVANSVSTVARGSFSAGRLYDRIGEECEAEILFLFEDCLIARVI